jgi:hypothetical protein
MDYAHFNLVSRRRGWVVKGTPNHGISSKRGKRSQVPCLNCFEVDEIFYDALRILGKSGNEKYEMGVLLNKRKLKNDFNVIEVTTNFPRPLPKPNKCHGYDLANGRFVLKPFNYCNVVRIEVPKNLQIDEPIVNIRYKAIIGFLVRSKMKLKIQRLLREKGLGNVKVFSVL